MQRSLAICLLLVLGSLVSVSLLGWADDLFVDSGQRLGNGVSDQVKLGDVDGDGDLDAVVGIEGDAAVLWINNGDALFEESNQALSGGEVISVADLDGDEHVDILVGGISASLVPWWNDGTGVFSRGETFMSGQIMELAVGDLNGDGLPEIFVGRSGADRLLVNQGDRSFDDTSQRLSVSGTGGVAFGDMDGDGDPDVVTAGWDGTGKVWANDGHAALTLLSEMDNYALHAHAAVLEDYDQDGDLDVFLATANGRCCEDVWINDGAGNLTTDAFDFGAQLSHGITFADVNEDGWNDVIFAIGIIGTAPSRIWYGGESGFEDSSEEIGNAFAREVAAGDLDGDGDIDLFITFSEINTSTYNITPLPDQVWLNTANDD